MKTNQIPLYWVVKDLELELPLTPGDPLVVKHLTTGAVITLSSDAMYRWLIRQIRGQI